MGCTKSKYLPDEINRLRKYSNGTCHDCATDCRSKYTTISWARECQQVVCKQCVRMRRHREM